MPFVAASYNVLASAYIERAWYRRTPALLLNPAWRVPALVQYIAGLRADLLALQEIEPQTLASLRATLSGFGYEFQYARKSNGRPDGCAIVYRAALFEFVGARTIVFDDGGGVAPNSGYVALAVSLRNQNRLLQVITTHLTWDPPGRAALAQRVGYRQGQQLLREHAQLLPPADGCIIAGDFNVTPENELIAAMERTGLHHAHREIAEAYTCNVGRKARTIDYLFHSTSLIAAAQAPVRIDDETILPSAEQPSDHVPIVARFTWKD